MLKCASQRRGGRTCVGATLQGREPTHWRHSRPRVPLRRITCKSKTSASASANRSCFLQLPPVKAWELVRRCCVPSGTQWRGRR